MKKLSKILLILFFALIVFSGGAVLARAQRGEQKFSITPFLIEKKVSKAAVLTEEIELVNLSVQRQRYEVTFSDFVVRGSRGEIGLPSPGELVDSRFSLASWLTAEPAAPELDPGQSQKIKLEIRVPADAEDGTHYGLVLFSTPQGHDVSGSSVSQKAGAVLLLQLGQAIEKGELKKFTTDRRVYDEPSVNFFAQFVNAGNVHLKPKGEVTVSNFFGRVLGEVKINRDADNVLPGSAKEFRQEWRRKFLFGRYTAEAVFTYGDSRLEQRSRVIFWVIPWKILTAGLVVLMLSVVGLYYLVRTYNAWVIRRSNKG